VSGFLSVLVPVFWRLLDEAGAVSHGPSDYVDPRPGGCDFGPGGVRHGRARPSKDGRRPYGLAQCSAARSCAGRACGASLAEGARAGGFAGGLASPGGPPCPTAGWPGRRAWLAQGHAHVTLGAARAGGQGGPSLAMLAGSSNRQVAPSTSRHGFAAGFFRRAGAANSPRLPGRPDHRQPFSPSDDEPLIEVLARPGNSPLGERRRPI